MTKKSKDPYYSEAYMPVYESLFSNLLNRFVKNYSRESVASNFNLSATSCLDIACGDGELINKHLSSRYQKCLGVDISAELISKANIGKSKNTKYYLEDINKFLLKEIALKRKYDHIYLLAILEHVQWPISLLELVDKLLPKRGKIIVEVPNIAWLPHRLSLLLGKFPVTAPTVGVVPGVYDEHIRFFTIDTLDQSFAKLGYERTMIDSSGKFRYIKNIFPRLLSPDIVAVYEKI